MAILIRYCCIATLLLSCAALPARAQSLQLHEQEIKAGLLYNFLKYTDWPATDNVSAMNVCIFGNDPFDGYLQPMAGRSVNQRIIALRTIQVPDETTSCHLLFVADDKKSHWPQLFSTLKGKSVLTVSDIAGFADAGGMLEFGRRDHRISVDLNMQATRDAGLRVQERLLRLVTIVQPAAAGGQ